jgi:hypothetical protein
MDLADARRHGQSKDLRVLETRMEASIRSGLTDAEQRPIEVVQELQDWRVGDSVIPDVADVGTMSQAEITDMIVGAALTKLRAAALELGMELGARKTPSPSC